MTGASARVTEGTMKSLTELGNPEETGVKNGAAKGNVAEIQ